MTMPPAAAPQRATKQQPLAITAQPQQPQCSERIHDVLVRFGLHERADCSIPLWSTATHHHITKKASPEQSTNEAIAEAFGDLRR